MPGGSKDSVDTIFLSLFALSGDIKTCREILDRLATIKGALPSYARSFWLGRCYAAADEKTQALSLFQEAMDSAPENAPAWKERIAFYIERIDQECAALSGHPADPETISQARALLRRNLLMGSVLDPGKKSPAVLALCISFAMVMLIMEGSNFGLHSSLGDLHLIILASGALEGHAVLPNGNLSSIASGDWWRLLSYQFIHANITHLLMNMFGLFWLGKNVERVFGSAWFVFIFLVSGILSGLLQLLITPELVAVGASGSVLGVFGAGIAATIRLKDVYSPRLRNAELKWMIGFAVFQIIFDQVVNVLANLSDRDGPGMRIASFTHLGGMISGFLLGMICPLQVKISDSDQASDYQS